MHRGLQRSGTGLLALLGGLVLLVAVLGLTTGTATAGGPLVVSSDNPRYFTIEGGDGRPVYLTGSHLWNNFHDGTGAGTCDDPPADLDWTAYLDFMRQRGQNFIRLWRWEQFKFRLPPELDTGGPYCVEPHPWPRTGPGTASDGLPKFDLSAFDQSYFDRLKARVVEARAAGIYVDVMLFEGFCMHLCDDDTAIAAHPFDGQNNVNGIDIDAIGDYQSLAYSSAVKTLQKRYIRKVMRTVQNSDNVLYEVVNESDTGSVAWQDWVVRYVKRVELRKGWKRHPIGRTAIYPGGADADLFASDADWISPGTSDADYANDPLAATGAKVIVSDNDHYLPCATDAAWAWKSFTRGLNPILLDCGIADPLNPLPDFDYLEPTRYATGDTRALSEQIDLASMPPRGDLTSTAYALAHPGHEYVVYQPTETLAPFTVTLEPGTYAVRWFSVDDRTWVSGSPVTVTTRGAQSFVPPWTEASTAALHLKLD